MMVQNFHKKLQLCNARFISKQVLSVVWVTIIKHNMFNSERKWFDILPQSKVDVSSGRKCSVWKTSPTKFSKKQKIQYFSSVQVDRL